MRSPQAAAAPVPSVVRRLVAATAAVLLAIAGFAMVPHPTPASADEHPALDEIEAARAAVSNAAATVDELDAAMSSLEDALETADMNTRIANENYTGAQQATIDAERQLFAAENRAQRAEASLTQAQGTLANVARTAYRHGGTMGSLEALTSADGFSDVVVRSEALSRASIEADTSVQRVRAAELVAGTMRTYAQSAADAAERAQEEASQALDEAQQARLDAQEALDEVESTREAAIQRLSELRNVSVELERERQEGLARERQEQQRDEFENTQSDPSSSDGGSGGSGSSGGSSGSSDSGSGGNDSGGSDSGGSGSSGGETSGSWSTTAAQGQTAVDRAMSRLGATYNLGGTGPTYDCSGLTMTSWAAAGVSIPRTSRGQYSGTTQVPFSQRRPGDLLFWGTNRDSSRIYHVAMYIGNGQIVEASNYGIPVRVRDYDAYSMDKLLPTVGRP